MGEDLPWRPGRKVSVGMELQVEEETDRTAMADPANFQKGQASSLLGLLASSRSL